MTPLPRPTTFSGLLLGVVQDEVHCGFCTEPTKPVAPARVLTKHVANSIESKAAFKCFDFILAPLANFISPDVMMTPQLLRFLLCNVTLISESYKFYRMKELLLRHLALHPPCRPGMPAYYLSVLIEPLTSNIFEKNAVTENFFDFFNHLKIAFSKHVQVDVRPEVPATLTHTEVIEFLKESCKSTHKSIDKSDDLELDIRMFVFKYCVDILLHDFIGCGRNRCAPFTVPLVTKVVCPFDHEFTFNQHCSDSIALYMKTPEMYRLEVGKYLTLLAAASQRNEPSRENLFQNSGDNQLVESLVEKLAENEISSSTAFLVESLSSDWLKCQVLEVLIYKQILKGAKYPKKITLSTRDSRVKKYYSIFDKKKLVK